MATRTTTTRTTTNAFGRYGVSDKPVEGGDDPFLHLSSSPTQYELFSPGEIPLVELFDAYESCRRNKRRTMQARLFEIDYEQNLIDLWREINSGTYIVGRSSTFIVDSPVKREIFAADFRDRIVHHLVINKTNHLFEKRFIDDSYACRVGKGTHHGIQRLSRFMRSASDNGLHEAWVLRLDSQGFFMSIDRALLWTMVRDVLVSAYAGEDLGILLGLCSQIIFNDPTNGCRRKSPKSAWCELPASKSLFGSKAGCGLPIGNLTSQVFANLYLSGLDHYIKHDLGFRYYGRYVDDIVLVHANQRRLVAVIPLIRDYLSVHLGLTLHPRKISLQRAGSGTRYLGAVVKPWCILANKRTIGCIADRTAKSNALVRLRKPTMDECMIFRASMNASLGLLCHWSTYRVRLAILGSMDLWWWHRFRVRSDATAVVPV